MAGEQQFGLPTSLIDLNKRYDIYHCVSKEERVYENVKLIALQGLHARSTYSFTKEFLEIETVFGSRMLIEAYGIHMICEHGMKPIFKVFRSWGPEA